MAKITIDEQIAEIERGIEGRKYQIKAIEDLFRYADNEDELRAEIDKRTRTLPNLEAVLETLKWLKANRDLILKIRKNLQAHDKSTKS